MGLVCVFALYALLCFAIEGMSRLINSPLHFSSINNFVMAITANYQRRLLLHSSIY